MWVMVDDDHLPIGEEAVQIKRVRFRTLGCYPLTGAVGSSADDLSSIVLELLNSRTSERQGERLIHIPPRRWRRKSKRLFQMSTMQMSTSDEVNEYLKQQNQLDLLRFITCGSVDDGKSTLIGRMLYEARLMFEDQVAAC